MDRYKRIQKLTGTEGKEFKGHQKRVTCIRWNNEGRRLATASTESIVKVWQIDLATGLVKKSIDLKGHTDVVQHLCWDPWRPDIVATASSDKTVRLWDTRSATSIRQINTGSQNLHISWHPVGQTLAVGSKGNTVSLIDLRTFELRPLGQQLTGGVGGVDVNEIRWNLSGDLFMVCTGTGELKLFDYPSLQPLDSLSSHTDQCFCVDLDPMGRFLITGGADALACLWDTQDWVCARTFQQLDWPVQSIGFSYDGLMVASGSKDTFIDVSCVETGESIAKVKTSGGTSSLHWHPRKAVFAYSCDEVSPRTGQDEGNFRIFGL